MEHTLKIAETSSQQFYSAFHRPSKIIIIVYTLTILRCIILDPHSEQKPSVSLPLRQGHFRVVRISFYIQILHSFETQLIETSKCIPTTSSEMWYVDIWNRKRG